MSKKEEKDQVKLNNINTKCRIRNDAEENIFHLICSCSHLAHTLYLADSHNQFAQILCQEITRKSEKIEHNPPEVTKINNMEIWWDKPVKTVNKVKKNKPYIVIWDLKDKSCNIVEVSVPLDTNSRQARDEKEPKYIPLISQLQKCTEGLSLKSFLSLQVPSAQYPMDSRQIYRDLEFKKQRQQH